MTSSASQATQSKEIVLASRPDEMPKPENFRSSTATLTPINDGEFLVKNQWMSVDPYMRGRMKDGDSYVKPFQIDEPLEGGCVGEVVESQNSKFNVGDIVLGNFGWREYWKSNGHGTTIVDAKRVPPQTYLGVLGMTGMTAWVGLNVIAKLQSGSTVFVSAASGAVGSIVVQLAKAKGCRVIGSAGHSDKIAWLEANTKIDAVINYKETDDLLRALSSAAPDGIDVYFDNVGGDHLEAALAAMNDFGCCVECGMISTYNASEPPAAPRNLANVIGKRIRMQGFIVRDHMDSRDEFIGDMIPLIDSKQVVWEESVVDGIENAPDAFIGLFKGHNLGKQLVRIA
ncbi:NADP-dependent oxidoreductase [Neorhodopirellula pilleata]|uniref:Putative NADP-dependent oxidoreductase YfmJ n=1 Tax=Neorhodopirellula pilleata TaxID=2714738 RepID=A0A5C5ZVH8_9BACT|nr:NADP-dependent oxidoreductase [Neorhodopirellula pilleata]TWT91176.1 putative NADP-dependent oxidoreductase YfmJ [Neorhodopirellula pilleata]